MRTLEAELRSAISQSRVAGDPPEFAFLQVGKTKRTRGFSCSVLAHIAVILLMFFGSGRPGVLREKPLPTIYTVRYLQLRVPEPPRVKPGGRSDSAVRSDKIEMPKM